MTAPSDLRNTLTRPSGRYRSRAWMAMLALLGFLLAYLGLAGWFGYIAWYTFAGDGITIHDSSPGIGLLAGFLSFFMIKSLFFVRRGKYEDGDEIKAADAPRLFAFLHQLADEARAPRPKRVYLSKRVNASVFYDLSFFNFFFASRKNLEIGLPLVNMLNVTEFRAVLAHEFGHFAQRSMAVGRWVYIAGQIASHLVHKRDWLDSLLLQLSYTDFRIAWLGWVLRLIIWAIRSMLHSLFLLVVLAERALSREMEFQADLVAVSLTGSDALIHALHKLHAAEDTWGRTMSLMEQQIRQKRVPENVFTIQQHFLLRMQQLLDDPLYGVAPPVPLKQPEQHRVFVTELAQPPKMWSSHPFSHEREANAKRIYLAAPIDDETAWSLFDQPEALQLKTARQLVKDEEVEWIASTEVCAELDRSFARELFNPRYRGAYRWRALGLHTENLDALYLPLQNVHPSAMQQLYPAELRDWLDEQSELERERDLLQAVQDGIYESTDGLLRHRGRLLRRKQLPQAIAQVQADLDAVNHRIREHDARARSIPMALAKQAGQGWPERLRSLLRLVHYTEHAQQDIEDAFGLFRNTLAIVTASRVTEASMDRLLQDSIVLHSALKNVYDDRSSIRLDLALQDESGHSSWTDWLGDFGLNPANSDNINDWIAASENYVQFTVSCLEGLHNAALTVLLQNERALVEAVEARQVPEASAALTVPQHYTVRPPAKLRPRQKKLDWWARFLHADSGYLAAVRFAIAVSIVGFVLLTTYSRDELDVHVYNGLGQTVVVQIGDYEQPVSAGSHITFRVDYAGSLPIRTQTQSGLLIEAFDAPVSTLEGKPFYNVAAAIPLREWDVHYQYPGADNEVLHSDRWFGSQARLLLETPPSTSSERVIRALAVPDDPFPLLSTLPTTEQARLISLHLRHDLPDSAQLWDWLRQAGHLPDARQRLQQRVHDYPEDVLGWRSLQDMGDEEKQATCRQLQARNTLPEADHQYLLFRCLPETQQNQAAQAGVARWADNPWWNVAAGYAALDHAAWSDGARYLQKATAHQQLKSQLSSELVRVQRAAHLTPDLVEGTDEAMKISLETDTPLRPGSVEHAFYQLYHGELNLQANTVSEQPEAWPRLLRLSAASPGAPDGQIKAALALPGKDGIDVLSFWSAWALAQREHAAPPDLAALPTDFQKRWLPIMQPLQQALLKRDFKTAEQLGQKLPLVLRGQVYVMGVVLYGEHAPKTWLPLARALSLPLERPWLPQT
ncbi:M48 family metallopeptidase [Leeia sp.]|uniref:M48 family metallopeptidase n=1 Tax=Leeia sp. TaxID=2884678 RepID=UPI0035B14D0B